MKVCYTAIFGKYEELKDPKVITPGWEYICFTDQPLRSGVWNIQHVDSTGWNPQLLARHFKIWHWIRWPQSIWIDGSFTINTDLNNWWDKNFKSEFSVAKHPIRDCLYEEGRHCIKINRGSARIAEQMKEYESEGVPVKSGLITSGLIMRENKPEVIELCEKWWQELQKHSIRDQISFAKVALNFNCVHTYNWDYRISNEFIYKKHYHLR